jgi:hypothetical protein
VHGDHAARNFPQYHPGVGKRFAILQDFSSIYQLEIVYSLWTILLFCTNAQLDLSNPVAEEKKRNCPYLKTNIKMAVYNTVPFGQWLRILSLMLATVVAGAYLLGPMSVPSYKRNLSSTGSSKDITDIPSTPLSRFKRNHNTAISPTKIPCESPLVTTTCRRTTIRIKPHMSQNLSKF